MRHATLIEAVDSYILSHPMCAKHKSTFRNRLQKFIVFMGGEVLLSDLTADDINRFLISLERSHRQPATVRGFRTGLISVLKFTKWKADEREDIRRVRVPRKVVTAWTHEQIYRLIAVAETLEGFLPNGVRRSTFWLTAILGGYSTGLRWGDLSTLPVSQIRADRSCTVVMSKTQRPVTVRFSELAMRCIEEHGQAEVLPCPCTQKWFCAEFSKLVERAEIRGGSFRWLRRSAGSYADRERHGDGRRLLGHCDDVTFNNHYRDEAIVGVSVPEPTALVDLRPKQLPAPGPGDWENFSIDV